MSMAIPVRLTSGEALPDWSAAVTLMTSFVYQLSPNLPSVGSNPTFCDITTWSINIINIVNFILWWPGLHGTEINK